MGYTCSNISKIRVKNFRIIEDITLEFDGKPIICLAGDNDSGKTSLMMALSVCSMNSHYMEQKNFIKDGKTAFGIEVVFEDGSSVLRYRGQSNNVYVIKKPDGTESTIQKIESGLHDEVYKIFKMDMEVETKESLNFRGYMDKLMFVTTSGGSNYKIMYNALKVSQITNGIKAGKLEVQGLRGKLADMRAEEYTNDRLLRELVVFQDNELKEVRNEIDSLIHKVRDVRDMLELVEERDRIKVELGYSTGVLDGSVAEVDLEQLSKLYELLKTAESVNELKAGIKIYGMANGADTIDIHKANEVYEYILIQDKINGAKSEIKREQVIGELSTVETDKIRMVSGIIQSVERHNAIRMSIPNISDVKIVGKKKLDMYELVGKMIGYMEQVDRIVESRDEAIAREVRVIDEMRVEGLSCMQCPICEGIYVSEIGGHNHG